MYLNQKDFILNVKDLSVIYFIFLLLKKKKLTLSGLYFQFFRAPHSIAHFGKPPVLKKRKTRFCPTVDAKFWFYLSPLTHLECRKS